MYGHRQHALHAAGNAQLHTVDAGVQESNTPEQISTPGLYPGSVCPVSAQSAARSNDAASQPFSPSTSISIPCEVYDLPIQVLDLSIRLFLCFQRTGILTVGQLLEMDLEALHRAKLGEKSIQELIERVLALKLLDTVHQVQREESSEAAQVGRHDNRQRPGRGKRRAIALSQPQPQEQSISGGALFCHKVPVACLPFSLRLELPRWARCGIEQGEENKLSREELPRRTRYCYVQPFILGETGELEAWQPNPTGDVPSHYRVAATPDALRAASFIEVDAQETQALKRELVSAAVPSPLIRVAPACFLTEEMRAMIAPGVSFPDTCIVPGNAAQRRVSLAHGNQVAIPPQIAEMRIEDLPLSVQTLTCLKRADINTVDALLELEEESLVGLIEREGLWELYTAVFAKGVLPTSSDLLPTGQTDEEVSPMPVFETFYYYPTGTTYDDPELGRLYLVRATLFVDRLDGSRSGPVETLWLTRAQIGQSLLWHRGLAQLEAIELRTQVTRHAVARGAALPQMKRAEERCLERKRRMLEMEVQYNLVPLRSEHKKDAPLELFISEADLKAADQNHLSPTSTVIAVLERYLEHPAAQPVSHRLSVDTLNDIHYWLTEDHKELRRLKRSWRRLFPGQPCPAGPSIVMHEEYVKHTYKKRNEETRRIEVKEITELVGYRLLIGVLASTPVPSHLIIEPCRGKPQCAAPERPIRPNRTPNYVPVQPAA